MGCPRFWTADPWVRPNGSNVYGLATMVGPNGLSDDAFGLCQLSSTLTS